ncbi:MAG: protein-L-isoaspartate(D-aspartate) O-methyltransferase [Endomicrobiia bacterium]
MNKKIYKLIFSIIFIFLSCNHKQNFSIKSQEKKEMNNIDEHYQKRLEMLEYQLKRRDITDEKVLSAMLKVERHRFVPKEYEKLAYTDEPLPIGFGQTISQPYIVALMTQLLELKGDEKILEIGTGSGYQAAILAELVKEVYTIEIIPQLAQRAEKLLKDLGYKNIFVKIGDGYLGWQEYAPYDGIIVTCAPDHIPQPLIDQLKDGGKIVIPVGDIYQELVVVEKKGRKIIKKNIIPVRFVPMKRLNE